MSLQQQKEKTCAQLIDKRLSDRVEDFEAFMNAEDLEENVYNKSGDYLGSFYDYGLDFGYVEPNTFEGQRIGYFRYQLSWGGPSDELQFFRDGSIEYHYKDWFDGAKVEVSAEDWAQWLNDCFDIESQFEIELNGGL